MNEKRDYADGKVDVWIRIRHDLIFDYFLVKQKMSVVT